MNFKNKKHIVIPAAIVVYTVVVAIYTREKLYIPEEKAAYLFVVGVGLALAVALYFIYKKREDLRNKNKK